MVVHTRGGNYSSERLYFAFRSDGFSYDCVSCKAHCCRGHGYSLSTGQELDTQLRLRPSLRMFLSSNDAGTSYHVSNCAPACFFLTHDNTCSVQVTSGYQAKPETCRLFPFNHFRRVGDFLIILPHVSLCPLKVSPGGSPTARLRSITAISTSQQRLRQDSPASIGVGSIVNIEGAGRGVFVL